MALFRTRTAAVFGIDAHLIDVEVDMYPGSGPRFHHGRECRTPRCARAGSASSRRCSIPASAIPTRRVTINLAPANVRKEGAGFDLPMALGILGAMGTVAPQRRASCWSANFRSMARSGRCAARLSMAVCARRQGIPNLLVPADNAAEAAVAEGVQRIRHAASGRSGQVI